MFVAIGDTQVSLFLGAMGIKSVYLGGTLIYQRPGGYLFINFTQ